MLPDRMRHRGEGEIVIRVPRECCLPLAHAHEQDAKKNLASEREGRERVHRQVGWKWKWNEQGKRRKLKWPSLPEEIFQSSLNGGGRENIRTIMTQTELEFYVHLRSMVTFCFTVWSFLEQLSTVLLTHPSRAFLSPTWSDIPVRRDAYKAIS